MPEKPIHSLYESLVGDEDARACSEIDSAACKVVPGNFFKQLLSFTLTKLGDALASPKTTLPWVFTAVAAPVWMIGWLVPIRESGSLIPQLVIGAVVRRMPIRKWIWVAGALLQAFTILAMAWGAISLEHEVAGWVLLSALCLFSLSRGLSSIASKDVLGKTVPKHRRGRLMGLSVSAAGLVSLLVSGILISHFDTRNDGVLAGLLAVSAMAWVCAAGIYASVDEYPGATGGGGNALREALSNLQLLRVDAPFRRFVVTRALLLVSALTAPYLVLLAQQHGASGTQGLPLFIIASGAASLLSGPFWGRLSDMSSRTTMVFATMAATAVAALAAILHELDTSLPYWPFVVLFFLLSVAHAGVRLGRKTYIVDIADGNRRTDYVSVSNTAMGVILLAVGAATGALGSVSVSWALTVLCLMGIAGAIMGYRLPSAE